MELSTFFILPAKNSLANTPKYAAAKINLINLDGSVIAGGITGIFDTGASGSMIDSDIASTAGLVPVQQSRIVRAGKEDVTNIYKIYFDIGGIYQPSYVAEGELQRNLQNYSALIGMDILSKFLFFSIDFAKGNIELR